MLSILAGLVTPTLITSLLSGAGDIFLKYQQNQITKAQLEEHLKEMILQAFTEVEQAYAKSLSDMYSSFMQAVVQSKIMQRTWATVVLSQTAVLVWAQLGVPAVVAAGWVEKWPSAGATIDWAYYLVGACLGFGPLVLKRTVTLPKL